MGKAYSSQEYYPIHHHNKMDLSNRIHMISDSAFLNSIVNCFYFVFVIFLMFLSNNIVGV